MTIKALSFDVKDIGATVKSTKRQYTWRLSIDGKEHVVQLMISYLSGKRRVIHNGKQIYINQNIMLTGFQFPFSVESNMLNIIQTGDKYELRINNNVFEHLLAKEKMKSEFTYEKGVNEAKEEEPSDFSKNNYGPKKYGFGTGEDDVKRRPDLDLTASGLQPSKGEANVKPKPSNDFGSFGEWGNTKKDTSTAQPKNLNFNFSNSGSKNTTTTTTTMTQSKPAQQNAPTTNLLDLDDDEPVQPQTQNKQPSQDFSSFPQNNKPFEFNISNATTQPTTNKGTQDFASFDFPTNTQVKSGPSLNSNDPFAAFGNTNTASTQQSNFGNFADFGFGNFQQPKPQVQNAAEFGNFGNFSAWGTTNTAGGNTGFSFPSSNNPVPQNNAGFTGFGDNKAFEQPKTQQQPTPTNDQGNTKEFWPTHLVNLDKLEEEYNAQYAGNMSNPTNFGVNPINPGGNIANFGAGWNYQQSGQPFQGNPATSSIKTPFDE